MFKFLFKLASPYDRYYDTSSVGDASGKNERDILDSIDDKKEEKEENNEEEEDEEEPESLDEDEESEEEDNEEESDDEDNEGDDKEGKEDRKGKKEEEEDEDDGQDLDDAEEETSIHQQLKKKFKGIYKQIPELRGVLFREQEFTKLHPTIDDAKEAKEMAETFIGFQKDIESGNTKTLLEATKELGPEVLREFAGNFLPALIDLDKDTYLEVVSPEFKRLLRAAAKDPNEDIRQSAKNLNYFLWKTTDIDKDEGFTPAKKDDKEEKVNQKEKKFHEDRFIEFRNDTISVAVKRAKKIIANSIKDFDLSDLTKQHLTEEIFKRMTNSLKNDVRHNGNIDNLWKKAIAAGLNTEEKERIINAFLSRAKVSIPKHRMKVLSEAKVSAKKAQSREDKKQITRLSGNNSSGKSGRPLGKINPKDVDWDKTSERDLLDGKQPIMRNKG